MIGFVLFESRIENGTQLNCTESVKFPKTFLHDILTKISLVNTRDILCRNFDSFPPLLLFDTYRFDYTAILDSEWNEGRIRF